MEIESRAVAPELPLKLILFLGSLLKEETGVSSILMNTPVPLQGPHL